MRNELEAILKNDLRTLSLRTRARLRLTQEQMAEHLCMSPRSYIDIESGLSMCGTLTVVLLLMDQDDPASVLAELRGKFSKLRADGEVVNL